jgi:hypothetical protein
MVEDGRSAAPEVIFPGCFARAAGIGLSKESLLHALFSEAPLPTIDPFPLPLPRVKPSNYRPATS